MSDATRPDVSVVIPTHDRCESLTRTLDGLVACVRDTFTLEAVVVANRCTDETERALAARPDDPLRVRVLTEDRPGKNWALNRALDDAPLGELVVFTDDDIDPAPDWIEQIVATSARWPARSVFGGRIDVVWPIPEADVPDWARSRYVMEFGFSAHDRGEHEHEYEPPALPFGPNYWIRRELVDAGARFRGGIGPSAEDRILGDETLFLRELRAAGHAPIYAPGARVGHRIQRDVVTARGIRRRAYELGRGIPHNLGLPRPDLLDRRPLAWRLSRNVALLRDRIKLALTTLTPGEDARVRRAIAAARGVGYNVECLRLAAR